jgi:alpha-ribazole phosphatase
MDFFMADTAKMQRLILVRHGDTGDQFRRRYIGSTDIPLSIRGRQQAAALKKMLGGNLPDIRLSSPLLRCRETADILMEGIPGGFNIDPDLREIDFGQWEKMTFGEILAASPHDVARWTEFDPDFAFPRGESIRDFQARLKRFAETLADTDADSVLAVTHGGVIRFLICQFLQLSPWQYILFEVKPASVTVIQVSEGKGTLAGLNLTVEPYPGLLIPGTV